MSLLDSCESTSDDLRPAIDASLLEVRWLVTTSGTALHCERPHSSLSCQADKSTAGGACRFVETKVFDRFHFR